MQRELPGVVVPNVGRDIDVAAHLFFHAAFFIAIGAFGGGRKDVQKSDHQPTGAFLHTDYAVSYTHLWMGWRSSWMGIRLFGESFTVYS